MQQILFNNYIILILIGFLFVVSLLEIISRIQNIKIKKFFLIIISILILSYLDFYSFLILLTISSILYTLFRKKINLKKHLVLLLVVSFVVLIAIKDYSNFFTIADPYRPLGVSFYFFRLISMAIDYSQKPENFQNLNMVDYFCYVFFFPLLLAGPIQRFVQFKDISKSIDLQKKILSYRDIFLSLMAKVIVVDYFLRGIVYRELWFKVHPGEPKVSIVTLFIFGFLAFLHAYLDLMLYTRISNGLSTVLGFTHQINFNKPLLASNISQFWQRWHISLSSWVRDYVFFPVLVKTKRTWIASYAALLVIASWHSLSLSWLFWGIAHGTALNIYSGLRKTHFYRFMTRTTKRSTILRIAGTMVTLSFVSTIFIFVARGDFWGTIVIFKKLILRFF